MAPSELISIVVADDDDAMRSVTADCLRASGMTVWEANDGEQALALVREHHPTVLLLDLWMPGLDGLKVLDAIRFDPAASRMAVIILTGDGQADGRLLALAGGAARILLKGGPFAELLDAVRTCADGSIGPPFGIGTDPDDPGAPGGLPGALLIERAPHPTGPDLP